MERPGWHEQARCRGDDPSRWVVERHESAVKLADLRAVCAGCPVAGACLAEGLAEPPQWRAAGPVRAGVASSAWRQVRALVAEWGVESDADFDALAAWLLDGDLAVSRGWVRFPDAVA